ncbi:MAG: transposase, partial [Dehalococcoidia bacterium]|nr:transposase [Dehalococcoidia bacterium]
ENATFVSDSLSAQLKTPARDHQLCLAHLLRELNYFEQIYHHQWATEMKDLLTRAIKLKDIMSPEQYTGSFGQRTAVINEFDILINQTLPDTVPKIVPFQKRLKKRRHQVFNFLFYPDVPYDNNGSYHNFSVIKTSRLEELIFKHIRSGSLDNNKVISCIFQKLRPNLHFQGAAISWAGCLPLRQPFSQWPPAFGGQSLSDRLT